MGFLSLGWDEARGVRIVRRDALYRPHAYARKSILLAGAEKQKARSAFANRASLCRAVRERFAPPTCGTSGDYRQNMSELMKRDSVIGSISFG